MSFIEERDKFRRAERRVRHRLFGDGVHEPGRLKGEEAREDVTRDLRRMREAFDAVVAGSEEGHEQNAARVADMEEELKRLAATKARRARRTGTAKTTTSPKRTPKKSP